MIWSVRMLYFVSMACVLLHTLEPRVLLHRFHSHVVVELGGSWVTGSQRPTTCMPFCAVDAVKNCTEHKTSIRDIVACMSACPTREAVI
jgi:hypothetical protein